MYIMDNAAKLVLTAEQIAETERLATKKLVWIRAAAGKAKHKSVLTPLKLRFQVASLPVRPSETQKSSLHSYKQSAGCF